jgi:hypothetical protein
MFFILTTGRRNTKSTTVATLEELGEKVTKMMANQANDGITVAIGKTDQAVMPYVWIRRHPDTDEWEGELGDSIRLGIKEGLLNESDPIQMVDLSEAIMAGIASVEDDGPIRTVTIPANNTPKPKKSQKRSEENLQVEAKRIVDELFKSLK